MTKQLRLSALLLPLLILSACATDLWLPSKSEKIRDPSVYCVKKLTPGKGRIWTYRTAPKGLGIAPDLVVDNKTYDPLLPGTGYNLEVPPGRHLVMLAYDEDKLEVDVESGQEIFVRFDVDPALFGKGFYPVLVDRETAQSELHQHAGIDFGCVKE